MRGTSYIIKIVIKRDIMKSKKIKIRVKDKELNALEDFLMIEFNNKKDEEKARKRCLTLWGRLVRKYDK